MFSFLGKTLQKVCELQEYHFEGNDIVMCANVLANNDGMDFLYLCPGSRDMTLP